MAESLHKKANELADPKRQLEILNNGIFKRNDLPRFQEKLKASGLWPLKPIGVEIFQVNLGYMCNQSCKHCHVDAGPDRKEKMTKADLQLCLEIIEKDRIPTLDITGGAPEMHPHFKWFVEEAANLDIEIIVRSNLTFLVQNASTRMLPDFFKRNHVRVVSSLPFYRRSRTDNQRGEGVFDKSIEALKLLNDLGYGKENSGLILDLVYNPSGAFMPPDQHSMEQEFKQRLKEDFDIEFNTLFNITNLPISRFLEYLLASENYEDYMTELVTSFNPAAAMGVMCRNTISVDYRGKLYDCDFNQMLELPVERSAPQHISEWDQSKLNKRNIVVNQHCFGCTAGAGSSCQGTTA